MLDKAGIMMANNNKIALAYNVGMNDNMLKAHYHDYYEVYFLIAGNRNIIINDQIYNMNPGDFAIIPPYVMHYSYGNKDIIFKRILLYFKKEEVINNNILKIFEKGLGIYQSDKNDLFYRIRDLLKQMLLEQEQNEMYKREYLQIILNQILILIERNFIPFCKKKKTNRIELIIQYLQEHYNEDIKLSILSKTFFISQYHLCREFKAYTNSTIVQYLNLTRIMKAQRELLETNNSITDISINNGFSNIIHFERVFKRITKMTPRCFRKNIIKNSK